MKSPNEISINMHSVCGKLYERRKLYFIVIPIVTVLSAVYIFSIPRYYVTDTKLAPEIEDNIGGGTLGSLASSIGIDFSNMNSRDAITPMLYPELMKDNKFVCDLLNVKINTSNVPQTTYYNYLVHGQKKAWWDNIIRKNEPDTCNQILMPYHLSKEIEKVLESVRKNITLNVDQKNGVVTITVQDQDPFICQQMADSVRMNLQKFITVYRTNKAKKDVQYYKQLTSEAKQSYERARQLYSGFSDSNTEVLLQSIRSKQEDLENEMQLKYNAYANYSAQLQSAIAKVQECTPVFTVLKGASVPVKPAGPKRVLFLIVMTLLSFFVLSVWILRRNIPDLIADR